MNKAVAVKPRMLTSMNKILKLKKLQNFIKNEYF